MENRSSDGKRAASDDKKRVNVKRADGVVSSGRGLRRVSELPDRRDDDTARAKRLAREEAEWNRGIIRVKGSPDRLFLTLVLILLCLGTVMVFSASYPSALAKEGDSLYYVKRQLLYMAVGFVGMIACSLIPYDWYRRLAIPVFCVAIVLLLLVFTPLGIERDEARRWIGVGGFTFQPSEAMKPALVLMLAWYLDRYRENVIGRTDKRDYIVRGVVVPFAIIGLACMLVVIEKHLSGTLILGMLGVTLMFIGGAHFGYTLLLGLIAGGGVVGLFVLKNPYALKRLLTFTDDNADVLSDKWQTTQGLYAIGSGGPLGKGLGGSQQKYSYVSEAQNDFIFTIWCEEMGFVGALFVICLFLAFIWRGYIIAMHAPDTFSALTVFGLVTKVGLQAFLNIGVVTDVLPNTGISLPFFSYGGSSLVILMLEMGVILSVSRHSYQRR